VTYDLFSDSNQPERLAMQDAEVYLFRTLQLPESAEKLLTELIHRTPWRAEDIVVWGKKYPQPRLVAWYGDAEKSYTYSGIKFTSLPWTELLLSLKNRIESVTLEVFNSVLLNYYRNHRDSMGMHSDDEPELGEQPVIASLSLGEQRTLVFKHKTSKNLKPVRLALPSGSLLLMKGDTQKCWKHGINKEEKPLGARVNLTFRKIYSADPIR
jgi:alkylated DNA repair dioxygenase AlkB